MKCYNCKCVIPDHSEYCAYCGRPVPLGNELTYRVEYGRNPRREVPYPAARAEDFYRFEEYPYGCAPYRSTPDYVQSVSPEPQREWDFSLVNEDGSLNYVKTLLILASLDICFVLILLLVILLMII